MVNESILDFGLLTKSPLNCFFQTINSSRQRVLEISKYGLRSQEATGWMMNYLATVENLARSGGRRKSRGVTWQMWQRLWRPQSTSSSLRKNGELEGGNNDKSNRMAWKSILADRFPMPPPTEGSCLAMLGLLCRTFLWREKKAASGLEMHK